MAEAPTRHHRILRLKLEVDLMRQTVSIGGHTVGKCGIGYTHGGLEIDCHMDHYRIDEALDATVGPDYTDAWKQEYRP